MCFDNQAVQAELTNLNSATTNVADALHTVSLSQREQVAVASPDITEQHLSRIHLVVQVRKFTFISIHY